MWPNACKYFSNHQIKSSAISEKFLYMCVEYFLSDGGCVFHFSELALGKKNKQKCLVSAFPQFLFLEEQTFCRRVERDVVLKLMKRITNSEIYCAQLWYRSSRSHIRWYFRRLWTRRNISEQHVIVRFWIFLTLAIFVSRVWIPVGLHCSVIRIFGPHLLSEAERLWHIW